MGPLLGGKQIEDMFEFPEHNYGVVYTTLCALEKSNLTSVNFDEKSPLRVAVYKEATMRNEEVCDYLEQRNVEYELVDCDSTEEQIKMLREGKADVLSSITLSYFDGTRVVTEFAPRPYYLVSTKGNTELIQELDEALEALNYTQPYLQSNLQEEFFGDTSGGYVLTDQEQSYLEEMKSFHVLCTSAYAPFSSQSAEGEPQGMLVSLLDGFAEENHLTVDYTFFDNSELLEEEWKTGNYDCMIGLPFTSQYCAKNSLIRTTPVISVDMVLFGKSQTKKTPEQSTVAVYNQLVNQIDLSEFGRVKEYETLTECYDAVEEGEADYACANRLGADYLLFEKSASFTCTPLLGKQLDIGVAVFKDLDYRFLSALNKYIHTLPDSTKTAYLSEATRHEDRQGLENFIHTQPVLASAMFSIIGILIVSSIILGLYASENKKRNIELVKANSAKSEFLSRMSHDIRTPMNAILGFAQLGKQDTNSPEQLKDDLDKISSSGEFLLGLVNDVLDMTKIENHAMELKPRPYGMEEFVAQIETLIGPSCEEKQIEFKTVFSEEIPECIYVDRLRFNQIFFNLLSNAVKFTGRNGKIEILGEKLGEKNGCVQLRMTVRDNGIGMSEEFQQHMFDSFAQEQQHITGKEGIGLGLSIVKSLVDLMQGTIQVKSKQGQGSSFAVDMSVKPCELPKKDVNQEALKVNESLKDKNILLCEDHPINTQLACRLLENVGAHVVCAINGREGVEKFDKSPEGFFDGILMDIRMPELDGIQATGKIRKLQRSDAKKVPIIAMTANAFEDDIQACKDAGMDAHLAKPFQVEQLYKILIETMH